MRAFLLATAAAIGLAGCTTVPAPAASAPPAPTAPIADEDARIADLVARMSLERKVAQLIQPQIGSFTADDMRRYRFGSYLNGGNRGPYGDEFAPASQWLRHADEMYLASVEPLAGGEPVIPTMWGTDAVHGHTNVVRATIFPHNIGLGAARDPDLVRRIGKATAVEIEVTGIDWNFSPTVAVARDDRWGRTYESYSEDPAIVAPLGAALVEGLQGRKGEADRLGAGHVIATAKHFFGDGGTDQGVDQGEVTGDIEALKAIHAAPYPATIDAGVEAIMASFNSINGVKMHGNKMLLTDVLRGELGFDGLVVGDWNGHGQVAGCTNTDCPRSLLAGLDIYMVPDDWKGLYETLIDQVRDGTIPVPVLDEAVSRILRVKLRAGLLDEFVQPSARPNAGEYHLLGSPEHRAIAREAVAKSLVLLKNEGSVLPIKPGARVLVAGPGADNMAMQAGGWTITWQGTDTTAADFPRGQTIGRAIADAVKATGGSAQINAAGDAQGTPEVAIIVFGEHPYAEFQGDAENLLFKNGEKELALLKAMKARGIPTVAVFLSGRPLFMGPQINAADAFVAAWLPGTQGQGVADVLVAGKDGAVTLQPDSKSARDFTGRLPFAWPADARSPVAAPLFPMGYGLDYAHPHAQGPVNEDPKVEQGPAASDSLFLRTGKVVDPWRLGIDSSVSARAVDVSAQEDARQFVWTGPGAIAIDGPPVDMTRQLNGAFALRIDWRIDAAKGVPVTLSLGGARLDISDKVTALPVGKPSSLIVPLRCFADAGATFAAVGTPLRLSANAGLSVSIRSILTEGVGEPPTCPPVAK